MYSKKAIGILGGVGPEAGVCLEQYILEETRKQRTTTKDQDHIQTFHLSCPNLIADRTAFLKHIDEHNPAEGAFKVLQLFETMAEHEEEELYVGIPCNTFHAQEIFGELRQMISASSLPHVHLLNMIEETAKAIHQMYAHIDTIGLLSTTGTREARIYQNVLEPKGFKIIEVPEALQAEVHDTIYHPLWGIKSGQHDLSITRANMQGFAEMLIADGAKAIILGCTEIPLVLTETSLKGVPLIDPMRLLASKLVQEIVREE